MYRFILRQHCRKISYILGNLFPDNFEKYITKLIYQIIFLVIIKVSIILL